MSRMRSAPPRLGAILIFCALAACSGDDPGEPGPEEDRYPPSPRRASNQTCFAQPPPPSSDLARWERFSPRSADLSKATHLVERDDGSWLVSTLEGRVIRFAPDSGRSVLLLDLSDRLDRGSAENGLVSIAPAPDGSLYAVYSVPADRGFVSRLGHFAPRPESDGWDASTESVVLDIPQLVGTHSMNHAAFADDGSLFVSVGDDVQNSVARRPADLSQDLASLKGKLLRIIPRGGAPYEIPPDNPFVDVDGAAPEIWALGLRNPWRFTIDDDGSIWLGDVGQDAREELNRIERGANYGWPWVEGTLCHNQDRCDEPGLAEPVAEYGYGGPKAIVGAPRYTGTALPELAGHVIFADYIGGHLWAWDEREGETARIIEGSFPISAMARGADGEIYATRYAGDDKGGIYRVVASPPGQGNASFPRTLRATGCVDPDEPTKPASGLFAYQPSAQLWSDGAWKRRYFAIPDDRRIGVGDNGELYFPEGSVLIKHFGYKERPHETRFYMRYEGVWSGYTYRWRDDGSGADLLESGLTVELEGGQPWSYPSRSECGLCHTEGAGRVLGLTIGSLRGPAPDKAEHPDQLAALLADDYFVPLEVETADELAGEVATIPDPYDEEAAPLADRARAYLHMNCAMCHGPDGVGRSQLDLRYATPWVEAKACDVEPLERLWGLKESPWDDQRLFVPDEPALSTIYLRMNTVSLFRMPPLGTHLIDERGAALIGAWIESESECP